MIRSTTIVSTVFVALACLGPLVAAPGASAKETRRYVTESPRNMTLELRFGLYRPNVDSEFSNGATPYKDAFGSGTMLQPGLELDWHILQKYGILAIGGGFGYAQDTGHGKLKNGEAATDSTKFHVLPLSLSLVYRWDMAARLWSVPLVPHVKAGFDYYLWWISNGVGSVPQWTDTATGKTARGMGGTFGGHVSFGLSFLMDWLEPDVAQTFDGDMGVNATYLYAEYVMSWIDDFNARDALNLSSNTFFFGIAFEF